MTTLPAASKPYVKPRPRVVISRMRQVGLVTSGVVALAALLVLIFVRTARPLQFTDGVQFVEGVDWRQAPRVIFGATTPTVEVPGPVRGRIARLPGGDFVFGRVLPDGSSDLVRFDPKRPDEEPIPLVTLNSRFQDFAPAVAPDGALWFCSDRSGGEGGFDLWRAEDRGLGRFGRPEPVGGPWNTEADEVDPAFSPDGELAVFARRLRSERTTLLLVAEASDGAMAAPRPLFPFDPGLGEVRLERDPVFSSDGITLHFSRSLDRRSPILMRSWRHQGEFSEPVQTQFGRDRTVSMRSPVVFDDGSVAVLPTGESDRPVLRTARLELAYPWWKAQEAFERMLLLVFIAAVTTFVLLLLGARFKRLDIVTWCLLLSLLIHLLLWLYVEGVRILDEDSNRPGDDEWSMEVAVYDGAADGVASDRPSGPSHASGSDPVTRRARLEGFDVDRPGSGQLAQVAERQSSEQSIEFDQVVPLSSRDRVLMETGVPDLEDPTVEAEVVADAELGDEVSGFVAEAATESEALVPAAERPSPEAAALALAGPSVSGLPRGTVSARATEPVTDLTTLPSPSVTTGSYEVRPTPVRSGPQVRGAVAADASLESRSVEGLADLGPAEVAPGVEPDAPAPVPIAVDGPDPRPESGLGRRRASAPRPQAARAPDTLLPVVGQAPVTVAVPRPELKDLRPTSSLAEASVRRSADDAETTREPGMRSLRPVPDPLARAAGVLDDVETGAIERSEFASSSVASGPAPLPSSRPLRRPTDRPARRGRSERRRGTATLRPDPQLTRRRLEELRGGPTTPELRAPDPVADAGQRSEAPDPEAREEAREAGGADATETRPLDQRLASALARAVDASVPLAPKRPVRRAPVETRSKSSAVPSLSDDGAPTTRIARLGRSDLEPKGPAETIASLYSNRFGPRKDDALRRFGGTEETERAVRDGLRYLASLQRRNGLWSTGRRDRKYGDTEIGRSALCVLAFLGAGHTQRSGTEHSAVVASALDALLRTQDQETGHFGRRTSSYSHGITTYALAECYAITKDERFREPLERAVAWIVANQDLSRNPRNHGGWGYFSPTLVAEDSYARSSVSAWMVMALESAQIGGIEVPDDTLTWAKRFLRSMFDSRNGYFLYSKEPSRLRSRWRTLPASSPAAAFCLLLLGEDPGSESIGAAMDYTVRRRPRRYAAADDNDFVLRADGNPYFWYYGTLASFMRGGEDWETWNAALKEVLLSGQSEDGSFAPIGAYASYAGDSRRNAAFTTALCVLSLEVYYRYFTPLLSGR